jgi:hypothetical protein
MGVIKFIYTPNVESIHITVPVYSETIAFFNYTITHSMLISNISYIFETKPIKEREKSSWV